MLILHDLVDVRVVDFEPIPILTDTALSRTLTYSRQCSRQCASCRCCSIFLVAQKIRGANVGWRASLTLQDAMRHPAWRTQSTGRVQAAAHKPRRAHSGSRVHAPSPDVLQLRPLAPHWSGRAAKRIGRGATPQQLTSRNGQGRRPR